MYFPKCPTVPLCVLIVFLRTVHVNDMRTAISDVGSDNTVLVKRVN